MINRFSVLIIFLFPFILYAQGDIKVISSGSQSITFQYTPSYSDTTTISFNNKKFLKVELLSGIIPDLNNIGDPAVPEKILSIGVPQEYGNTIEIISSESKKKNGMIIPITDPHIDTADLSVKYAIGKNYYKYQPPNELVTFGQFGYTRDIPTQSLMISPVRFYPGQNQIVFYTKIIFKVNYSTRQTIAQKPAGDFLKGVLINFDVAKNWIQRTKTNGLSKLKSTQGTVLMSGTWGQFETPTEGIYKITRDMLPSLGINPDSVDPSTIKIYNNGGTVLPENINTPRPVGLVENAILFVGTDDKHFNQGDYILLYGRGGDFWTYDSSSNVVKRNHNPYSNHNYYWITSGGAQGKRIQPQASLNIQNAFNQNTSQGFSSWDEDKINIGNSGREYFGDAFSQNSTSMTYVSKLAGRISGTPINYNIYFANGSPDAFDLRIEENSTTIFYSTLYGYGDALYTAGIGRTITAVYKGNLTSDSRSQLKFTITPYTPASKGYLDYFEIRYQKNLVADANNLLFFSKDTTSAVQYNLTGFSSSEIKVFNISDFANVKLITNSSISGGNCSFKASERKGHVNKYYAVENTGFLSPTNLTKISNPVSEDLLAPNAGADFIIITTNKFKDAAESLKTFKENNAIGKFSTKIVYVEDIYKEFSCGSLDPTAIRDFIRYAYVNWQTTPEYVLFFGKGTYDPKNVEGYNTDFVPTYQTTESLNEIYSYPTDDYFVEVSGSDPFTDLAYGRIPAMNDEQANDIVTKIIQYETGSNQGAWRNLITLVADDGWHGKDYEGTDHTAASETLANTYIPSSFDLNKIYLAAYPVEITSVGRRFPEVNKAIINAINDGTCILNYIGHGAPDLWADEHVFVQSTTIPQLHNKDYFFLSAATCDFGRYDEPNYQCSTESMLFLKDAGCIAAFSSSRLAYSLNNHQLLNMFYSVMFDSSDNTNNLPMTLGKISLMTKKSFYDTNSQKYEIFGDPTLRLKFPEYSAAIDSINNQSLKTSIQIRALSKVNVNGDIEKADGSLWSDYNGYGILSVYDSQRKVLLSALGNYPMTISGGLIFRGTVSVTDGKFDANFVVPKDISYENKSGKIVMYFYNSNSDGIGYTTNITVGGTDSSVVNNKIGPTMNVFFDDTTYKNTSLVNPNSILIVKLYDSNGLNTTGTGIGHKLEGVLNDDINNPIDFTNYFTGDLNAGGKSGEIRYRFTNDPGNYKLKVTAWDVYNNFSSKTINFTVVDNEGLTIKNVYNYPDPFKYNTTFTFQQNVSKPINVKIRIFTVAGRLIRQIEKMGVNEKFVKVNWDGRDQEGDIIANGTYLYKVIVQTADGEYNKSVLGKLAIIR